MSDYHNFNEHVYSYFETPMRSQVRAEGLSTNTIVWWIFLQIKSKFYHPGCVKLLVTEIQMRS